MVYNPNYSTTGQRNLSFGDGSTGRADISGSTSLAAASYYRDVNVRAAGVHTFTNIHVWVLGSYTLAGKLQGGSANNASGSSGGNALAANSLSTSVSGQNGVATAATGVAGGAGIGLSPDQGGGGNSNGTTQANGSHAQLPAPFKSALWAGALNNSTVCTSLFGGTATTGRGSGDGTNAGGGSGGGCASFALFARFFVQISGGVLATVGGNGGNGAAGTAGGGGGSGSGGMLHVSDLYVGSTISVTRTEGTGGTGAGGAGTGGVGPAGTTQRLNNK